MAKKNFKSSGGKRQFPPEWYASQAARRKNKGASSAASNAVQQPSTKVQAPKVLAKRKSRISSVRQDRTGNANTAEGPGRYVEFKRSVKNKSSANSSGTSNYTYISKYKVGKGKGHISEASWKRLSRVLKAREANSFKTYKSPTSPSVTKKRTSKNQQLGGSRVWVASSKKKAKK